MNPRRRLRAAAALSLALAARTGAFAADDAQARLGKLLFFDPRLSGDGKVSCATCHDPHKGWTDQLPVSIGALGRKGKRNAPTLLNVKDFYYDVLMWDGRVKGLEEQVNIPLSDPEEMAVSTGAAVRTVSSIAGYRPYFRSAYGSDAVDIDRIDAAIAAFERTLVSMDSPYDRYLAGDPTALSASALRGKEVFFGKGSCAACHSGPHFSDAHFHNIGVGEEKRPPDMGRYEISKLDRDRGAYRTPTLRDLRYTFPYMHDGSMKTLEQVVDFYDRGGRNNPWLDPDVQSLFLSPEEKKDLVEFLGALNGDPMVMEAPRQAPR